MKKEEVELQHIKNWISEQTKVSEILPENSSGVPSVATNFLTEASWQTSVFEGQVRLLNS